jgi:hypothetical protein
MQQISQLRQNTRDDISDRSLSLNWLVLKNCCKGAILNYFLPEFNGDFYQNGCHLQLEGLTCATACLHSVMKIWETEN